MDLQTLLSTDLQRAIDGEVIVPGPGSDRDLTRPFNARFDDVRPRAIVRCTSDGDVAETIAFIRQHGLRSATRSGGHDFAGRSTTPGILIDVSPMRSVTVADEVVRIGAGAVLGEVYTATIRHGLTVAGGTCPSVGIAGVTLGGGLGILGRTYGVTSDRLVAVRIVLADGRIVDCDHRHEPDLFWALRGAGTGHFGVVTELTFEPVPTPPTTDIHLTWPFAEALDLATAWMRWSPNAPDTLSASLLVAAGPDPDDEPSMEVVGTLLGNGSDAREQVEALLARVRSDPRSAAIRELSYLETMRSWAARAGERLEDPRAGSDGRAIHVVRSEFFDRPVPTAAIAATFGRLLDDRVVGQARSLDFSPWGGAYNRLPVDHTAFVHRDASFWIKHEASIEEGASAGRIDAATAWVRGSWGEVHPFGTGGVFPNFADPDLDDPWHAYYGANFERLCGIKARYDAENLFRFPQSLPLAAP
jgi:FAD/FMN-containing dehydrogenase